MREHLPPGTRIWQYTIDSFLGEGTFADTYLAHHITMTKRRVAIKQLKSLHSRNPHTVKRFIREAYAMAELCHPNVVTIFELVDPEHCSGEENYCIVMEYMDGGTLEELIADARQIALADAVRITRSILMGLSAAHQDKIYHRDIKPANVLLNKDRTVVKIGDWGLAHLDIMKMTILGSKMGTLQYMSPEQALGKSAEVDARSDIYSVGAVLYEMVTGRPYLDLETIAEQAGIRFFVENPSMTMEKDLQDAAEKAVFMAILKTMPTPPVNFRPDLPDAFSALIMKSLAKPPEKRFQSTQDFITELNEVPLVASRRREGIIKTDSSEAIANLLVRARHKRLESNFHEAFELLQEARQIVPHNAGVCLELAHIYNRMGNYEEAARILEGALEHNPDNYIILRDLGLTYSTMKNWSRARTMLYEALGLNPNQSEVIRKVSQIDRRLKGEES